MNTKRFLFCFVAVSIFIFAYDWMFHGHCLMAMYEQTAHLWRGYEEMKALYHWSLGGQALIAFMFCYIFTRGYEDKGILEGLRYGVLIGLLFSAPTIGMYSYMPVPQKLIGAWILGYLVQYALAGVIVAAIYRKE